MDAARSRVQLQFTANAAIGLDPAMLEAQVAVLAGQLRPFGEVQLERVRVERAPDGAKAIGEILTLVGAIIAIPAGIAQILQVIEHWSRRHAPAGVVEVEVVDLDEGRRYHIAPAAPHRVGSKPMPERRDPARNDGGRYALVVGNSRYEDARLTQLTSPAADVAELTRVLGDPMVGGFEVTGLTNVGWSDLRVRVASFFSGRLPDDVLLLYLSGHGLKESRSGLHLATTDTRISALSVTSVPVDFIVKEIVKTRSEHILLVLDCCFGGAFASNEAITVSEPIGIAPFGSGVHVFAAASATEYAFEGDQLVWNEAQPSAFAAAVVRGLGTGAADRNGDGYITADELFEFVQLLLWPATEHRQRPARWAFGTSSPLIVARTPPASDAANSSGPRSARPALPAPAVPKPALPKALRSVPAGPPPAAVADQRDLVTLFNRFLTLYERLTARHDVPNKELDDWMLDALKATATGVVRRSIAVPTAADLRTVANVVAARLADQHGIVVTLPE